LHVGVRTDDVAWCMGTSLRRRVGALSVGHLTRSATDRVPMRSRGGPKKAVTEQVLPGRYTDHRATTCWWNSEAGSELDMRTGD
jgi:hypothetical protein